MANTLIQLKYSTINNTPASLNIGEPAYSFTSDKLFIGNSTNHVLTIGGKYYVDTIEAATDLATGSTLVRRDVNGNASFNNVTVDYLHGTVEQADRLTIGRDIGLDGDVTGNVLFDGTQNVTLTVELVDSGVTPGTYGGTTNVPYFTVDVDGRITEAGNTVISTTLNIDGDTGSTGINLLDETLTIVGGDGVTTSANALNNSITVDVDNTVIRTSGGQTVGGDLAITGNLVIMGNTVTQDVETVRTEDTLIELAANNASDGLDIGFFGSYTNGGVKYTTLYRDASDSGVYKLLVDGTEKPSVGNTVNAAAFTRGTLDTNIIGGYVSGLSQVIAIEDGGTNADSFTPGLITYFDGTKIASLSNTGIAGTYSNVSHTPVITTDDYGRVSEITYSKIDIDTSQVTSGILPISRGGTNNDTYTTGAMLQFDGTKVATLANTTYLQTGLLSVANTITSLTVDPYGRVTAATTETISINANQVTSGELIVSRGGTGVGSFTANSVILGNGTGSLQTTYSSTEGHILTINDSGVPTFMMLSGGTF